MEFKLSCPQYGLYKDAEMQTFELNTTISNLRSLRESDLSAYDAYLSGSLEDPEFSEDDLGEALASLPDPPALA